MINFKYLWLEAVDYEHPKRMDVVTLGTELMNEHGGTWKDWMTSFWELEQSDFLDYDSCGLTRKRGWW